MPTFTPTPSPTATATPTPTSTSTPKPRAARVTLIQKVADCQWDVTVEITGVRPGTRLLAVDYYHATDCQGNRREGSSEPYQLGFADGSGKHISVHRQSDYGSYDKIFTDSEGYQIMLHYSYAR